VGAADERVALDEVVLGRVAALEVGGAVGVLAAVLVEEDAPGRVAGEGVARDGVLVGAVDRDALPADAPEPEVGSCEGEGLAARAVLPEAVADDGVVLDVAGRDPVSR